MSCGRSGSTLMDIMLGNHTGFVSVGELNRIYSAWKNEKQCSCGENIRNCKIWKPIGKKYLNSNYFKGINKYQLRMIEKSINLFKFMRIKKSNLITKYHKFNFAVLNQILLSSASNGVIDSSKSVGRGIGLIKNNNISTKVIHLVRDPRGVF